MTRTTLTVALTATQNIVTLGSVTGLTINSLIRVGEEYVRPVADPDTSALTVVVQRGANRTAALTHGAGEPVFFGTPGEFSARFGEGTKIAPTAQIATAGAATYSAGAIKHRYILRDPNGASRTDTLPTAALLAAAFPLVGLYEPVDFIVENQADAAETITIAAGSGGTAQSGHTLTIAQSNSKRFRFWFTNLTAGSEAYALAVLGTFTT